MYSIRMDDDHSLFVQFLFWYLSSRSIHSFGGCGDAHKSIFWFFFYFFNCNLSPYYFYQYGQWSMIMDHIGLVCHYWILSQLKTESNDVTNWFNINLWKHNKKNLALKFSNFLFIDLSIFIRPVLRLLWETYLCT